MALQDYTVPGQSTDTEPQNAGVEEKYDSTPQGIMKCINDIRAKLDALEDAVGGEETAEPEMAPQTDQEVAAGITPTPVKPASTGNPFGGGVASPSPLDQKKKPVGMFATRAGD